jgi:hypothetical protein
MIHINSPSNLQNIFPTSLTPSIDIGVFIFLLGLTIDLALYYNQKSKLYIEAHNYTPQKIEKQKKYVNLIRNLKKS